jgi:hypothetical protein
MNALGGAGRIRCLVPFREVLVVLLLPLFTLRRGLRVSIECCLPARVGLRGNST